MAVVETPDRIMTTGGSSFGEGGNSMWMLIMFVFLFLFRGREGFGEGGVHHGDGGYNGGNYKRYDADFDYLKRGQCEDIKEDIKARYEAKIAELECCCKTNANIDGVRCEVKEQGGLTRATMIDLELKETIERQKEKIIALEMRLNRDETLAGVARIVDEKLSFAFRGRGDCGCHDFPVRAKVEPIHYVPECNDERHAG